MEGAHTFAVYQAGNLFLTRSLTTLGHQMEPDDGGTKLFCICHSSRFDPTALEMNSKQKQIKRSDIQLCRD